MTARQMPWGDVWLIVELLFEAMSLEEEAALWEILQASSHLQNAMLGGALGNRLHQITHPGDEAQG